MGSYVISVSAGTGCYRHIQISTTATLYKLHQAILKAFDFEDDHGHAFFMDNHYWSHGNPFFSTKMRGNERLTKNFKLEKFRFSKGDQFKYIFDFGDEWRFQCKVLRETEDRIDIPCVIRRVGASPVQYPEPDWDEEESDWDEEDDELYEDEELSLPDMPTLKKLDELYALVPLNKNTIDLIHTYMDAANRLYGVISLKELRDIYNSQNPPVDENSFIKAAALAAHFENDYEVLERAGVPTNTPDEILEAGFIAADYLFIDDADQAIEELLRQQHGKPLKILPKEAFLKYADPWYYPDTPQKNAMLRYLRQRESELSLPADDFCHALQEIIAVDAPTQEMLNITQSAGLSFNKKWEIGEYMTLYQELNNHTPKHSNRGHTPNELFAMSERGKKQAMRLAPVENQLSLFDLPTTKPQLTLVGKPSRNAPCPCGSGRKYKNCCGKDK